MADQKHLLIADAGDDTQAIPGLDLVPAPVQGPAGEAVGHVQGPALDPAGGIHALGLAADPAHVPVLDPAHVLEARVVQAAQRSGDPNLQRNKRRRTEWMKRQP